MKAYSFIVLFLLIVGIIEAFESADDLFVVDERFKCGRLCVYSGFRCDYGRIPKVGWLKPHIIPANWAEARLRCKLEGATLASPLNARLYKAMLSLQEHFFQLPQMFIGIHATFSSGDYYSVEGVPLAKIPHRWAAGEPDNKNDDEKCLVMDKLGNFSDVSCRRPHPYLCYRPNDQIVMNECGTIDKEYQLEKSTGKCYKFHRTPRTWSRAFLACSAEGGHLAIINSEDEAAVIRKVYAENPSWKLIGTSWYKEWIFIGFHDWGELGDWNTIHGQTLEEAGYDTFYPGHPDNSTIIGTGIGEFCGSVFRDAKLNDLWCIKPHAFICEKDPKSLLCES